MIQLMPFTFFPIVVTICLKIKNKTIGLIFTVNALTNLLTKIRFWIKAVVCQKKLDKRSESTVHRLESSLNQSECTVRRNEKDVANSIENFLDGER